MGEEARREAHHSKMKMNQKRRKTKKRDGEDPILGNRDAKTRKKHHSKSSFMHVTCKKRAKIAQKKENERKRKGGTNIQRHEPKKYDQEDFVDM